MAAVVMVVVVWGVRSMGALRGGQGGQQVCVCPCGVALKRETGSNAHMHIVIYPTGKKYIAAYIYSIGILSCKIITYTTPVLTIMMSKCD